MDMEEGQFEFGPSSFPPCYLHDHLSVEAKTYDSTRAVRESFMDGLFYAYLHGLMVQAIACLPVIGLTMTLPKFTTDTCGFLVYNNYHLGGVFL